VKEQYKTPTFGGVSKNKQRLSMRVPSFNGDLSKTFGASLSNRIKTGKG
jgi:hypothetical protein